MLFRSIQGYFVTKQDDPALEEAAVEMVKFFTNTHAQQLGLEMQGMVPASSTVEVSAEAEGKYPLLVEFLNQAAGAQLRSDTLQATMFSNLLDVISQQLPLLAAESITPEGFCTALSNAAAKN